MVPYAVLSRTNLADRASSASRISFTSFYLRTLKLSCSSFSRSDPLFSIVCALFDKNTRGGIPLFHSRVTRRAPLALTPFRITTCKNVSKQRTLTSFKMNTYVKPRGRGVTSSPPFTPTHSVCSAPLWQTRLIRTGQEEGNIAYPSPGPGGDAVVAGGRRCVLRNRFRMC
jgi:hypothetical protein